MFREPLCPPHQGHTLSLLTTRRTAKRSFGEMRSQAGAWDRGDEDALLTMKKARRWQPAGFLWWLTLGSRTTSQPHSGH